MMNADIFKAFEIMRVSKLDTTARTEQNTTGQNDIELAP